MKIIICFTPLHILIAQRIIEKEKIEKFIFICMFDIDTEKNRYYYEKLKDNAVESYYLILKKNLLNDLVMLLNLQKNLQKYCSEKSLIFYTGKIKSFHVRFLMFLMGYSDFITFDDGSGNISGGGYFYEENENIPFRIFFSIFNKKLLYKNIKMSIKKHYSIYNKPNVFPNTHFIELFQNKSSIPKSYKNQKSDIVILLTNAFAEDNEMQLEDEKLLYQKIIDKYKVTHIIQHPREIQKKIKNSNIKEFSSHKISEELIYELNKDHNLTVIGIYSTVLLNLMQFRSLTLINVHANLKKPLNGLKELMGGLTVYV